MDVNALLARIAPRLWLIILLAVIGGAAGYAFSRYSAPAYRSEARLLVGQTLDATRVDYSDLLASQLLAQTYADLAGTTPILSAAGASLQPPLDAAAVDRAISARAPTGSIYVVISAEAGDPQQAAAIANAVATALQANAPAENKTDAELQDAIRNDLGAVDDQITAALAEIGELSAVASPSPDQSQRLEVLQARLETLRSQRSSLAAAVAGPGPNALTIVEPASVPSEAFAPRTVVNAALGALIGAAVGLVFVLLRPVPKDREAAAAARRTAAARR